ncbi:DUF4907 domain-containing protein [Mangrovibacterium marinum]|uniref:Uncharacterized protein DUF4907 n=1 Tax=Mangrovibacterium marinum TaxID=1639118 RepID=A0A2T5C3L0_9BACT|nr:DUF4907 domain-containing protein [Mangrovibacterium marinum]PTN09348.1 uncharacterized protein DUF4907 [Mangrovibacterium marinum]
MAILLGFSGVLLFSCKPQTIARVETKAVDDGWGYQILINDSPYIDQQYIPAISGKHRFQTEKDAQKTGRLVLQKMQKGQLPHLTVGELDSLGSVYTVTP